MSCVGSMMATGCNNFRPNFWKPATCANCFRPRLQHASAALGPPHGRTRSLTTSHIGGKLLNTPFINRLYFVLHYNGSEDQKFMSLHDSSVDWPLAVSIIIVVKYRTAAVRHYGPVLVFFSLQAPSSIRNYCIQTLVMISSNLACCLGRHISS